MKKVFFFFFLICFSVCSAQQKSITFVKTAHADKKWSGTLPAEAVIFYKNDKTDYLLIIGSTDSLLICKQNIYATNPDTIIKEEPIPYAGRNIDNMITCGQKTNEQIQKEYFEINFKDTVKIKFSELKSIKITNNVSDQKNTDKFSVVLFVVSTLAATIAFI